MSACVVCTVGGEKSQLELKSNGPGRPTDVSESETAVEGRIVFFGCTVTFNRNCQTGSVVQSVVLIPLLFKKKTQKKKIRTPFPRNPPTHKFNVEEWACRCGSQAGVLVVVALRPGLVDV